MSDQQSIPEGGEIVMRELSKVKGERDALRSRVDQLEAQLWTLGYGCDCGHTPVAHDEHGCKLSVSPDPDKYVRCHGAARPVPEQPQ